MMMNLYEIASQNSRRWYAKPDALASLTLMDDVAWISFCANRTLRIARVWNLAALKSSHAQGSVHIVSYRNDHMNAWNQVHTCKLTLHRHASKLGHFACLLCDLRLICIGNELQWNAIDAVSLVCGGLGVHPPIFKHMSKVTLAGFAVHLNVAFPIAQHGGLMGALQIQCHALRKADLLLSDWTWRKTSRGMMERW